MILEKTTREPKKYHLPETIKILKDWILTNIENPYPSKQVKKDLAESTGLSIEQVNTWFKHTRRKKWFLYTIKDHHQSRDLELNEVPVKVKNLIKI